jgi:hypothetical protein
MNQKGGTCIHCGRDSSATPLIAFEFRGQVSRICSQHLPVLIHEPARLVGQLTGAEGLEPAEHKD